MSAERGSQGLIPNRLEKWHILKFRLGWPPVQRVQRGYYTVVQFVSDNDKGTRHERVLEGEFGSSVEALTAAREILEREQNGR